MSEYDDKIRNFKEITQESDDKIAKEFLIKHDYVQEAAINDYIEHQLTKNTDNINTRNAENSTANQNARTKGGFTQVFNKLFGYVKNITWIQSDKEFNNIYASNPPNSERINPKPVQIEEEKSSLISNVTRTVRKNSENLNFLEVPNKSTNLKNFMVNLQKKHGLIFLYESKETNKNIINQIISDEFVKDIIKNSFTILFIDIQSVDGKSLQNSFKLDSFPACFFNIKSNSTSVSHENVFIILNNEQLNLENFRESLLTLISNDSYEPQNLGFQENSYKSNHSDSLIDIQKQELEELERSIEEKKNKEKKANEEKIKKEKELNEKKLEKKRRKESLIALLPTEPNSDDPDSYLIVFRSPNNDLRKERRFMKSDKIHVLYDYVNCFIDDFEIKDFILFRPFLGDLANKDKTIEEEKLSNAVIQIKEI